MRLSQLSKGVVLGLLLAVAMPAIPAHGQALLILVFGDKLSTEKFQVGINADLTWTNATNVDNSKVRLGWLFGAYGQIRLSSKLFLVPELIIKTPAGMKGFAIGDAGNPFERTDVEEIDEALATGTITRELNYLTVPIAIRYQVGRIGLSGGGYAGYMTGGSDILSSEITQGDLSVTTSVKDVLNRWDAGLQASINFSFKPELKMRSLILTVKGVYGLVDTVKDNPGDPVQNVGVFAGLAIPVGG